jgi:hypothetical protein
MRRIAGSSLVDDIESGGGRLREEGAQAALVIVITTQ